MEKAKIAFDLDGIIIDKPPLVPKKFIEWLFRGGKPNSLHYRIPTSKLEILIRKISHFYLFRPPIRKNIAFIKNLYQSGKYEIYIISGRYSFLEKETKKWLVKRRLTNTFKKIFLNIQNEQPHLFKEKILRKLKPEFFVDDDMLLSDYLFQKNICQIFFYSRHKEKAQKATTINILSEITSKIR